MTRLLPVLTLFACGSPGSRPVVSEPTTADPDTSTPPSTPTDTDTEVDDLCSDRLRDDQLATNVLVVLLDDVGIDKIGAYGEHPDPAPTPTIDALADQGVLFRNAYSYPACSSTRAAVLTGRYGERTGVGAVLTWGLNDWELQDREIVIPEMLTESPFHWDNAAIGKWHLLVESTEDKAQRPNRQGFDWFAGNLVNIGVEILGDPQDNDFFHWERTVNGVTEHSDTYNTTVVVDDALGRIAQMQEPWFLYLPMNAAHGPWHAPPADLITSDVDDSSTNIDKFTASLEAADTEIGRLLAAIDPAVLERTTVVLMTDNGTNRSWITSPWISGTRGKLSLFESGINIPLIVTGPLVGTPGSESEALVHAVDLFPTIAEVACVEVEAIVRDDGSSVVTDGESLVPYLLDPSTPGREFLYTEAIGPPGQAEHTTRNERVFRNDRYKLIEDLLEGTDKFYEFVEGEYEEGPNLLEGDLTADQQAAYDLLKTELAAFHAGLQFEY